MLKIILSTFLIVFIAELGDKTQIQTMLLTTQFKCLWPVFIGASLALIVSSFVGVFLGAFLTRYIPPIYLQRTSGIIFIVIGFLTLFNRV